MSKLTGIYDFAATMTIYPTHEQYSDMVAALLLKWPQVAEGLCSE